MAQRDAIQGRKAFMARCQLIGAAAGAIVAVVALGLLNLVAEYPPTVLLVSVPTLIIHSASGWVIGSTVGFLLTSVPEVRRRFWRSALPWGCACMLFGAAFVLPIWWVIPPGYTALGLARNAWLLGLLGFGAGLRWAECAVLDAEEEERSLFGPPGTVRNAAAPSEHVRASDKDQIAEPKP